MVTFGNIFSETFNEYKKNFKLYFKTLFILYVIPYAVFNVIIMSITTAGIFGVGALGYDFSNIQASDLSSLIALGSIAFLFFGVIIVVSTIMQSLMSVAIIRISKTKQADYKEVFKDSKRFILPFIALSFLQFFALAGLSLLLIIPAIIFAIYWIFSLFILVYEEKRVMESFGISKNLVKGNWWKVFGYLILFTIIILGFSFILLIPVMIVSVLFVLIPFIGPIFNNIIGSVLSIILTPFSFLFFIKLYEGLKKEKTN